MGPQSQGICHTPGWKNHPSILPENNAGERRGRTHRLREETKVRPHPLERRDNLQLRKTPRHDGGLNQASRGDGKPWSRGDKTNLPGCPELPVGTGSSGSSRAPHPHRTTPAGTRRASQLLVRREAQAERTRTHRVGGRKTHRRTLVGKIKGPHGTSREELIRRPWQRKTQPRG